MTNVIPPLELSEKDHSSNIVCVNLYDLNRVLNVLSKMQEYMCELQAKQENDSSVLSNVSDIVNNLVVSVASVEKLSDEHQSDIDYLYKKISLHGCGPRSFFRDDARVLNVVRTLVFMCMLVLMYMYMQRV